MLPGFGGVFALKALNGSNLFMAVSLSLSESIRTIVCMGLGSNTLC